MEVLYRLRIDGNENSVMIKDGEIQYPVFMESLHAEEIFRNLLSSGYKFCGLPFDFRKDGRSITELPVQDYTPEMDEMQDMFDLNSVQKLSQDELRKNLSQEDVQYLPEADAEYTINTRQEFIEYLKTCNSIRNELDVRPINYFVHPAARFSVDEWRSGEYSEYFRIMANRRNMTWRAFNFLRDWLVMHGMDQFADAVDITKAYCAWGIDGLNTKFISKQQQTMLIQEDYILTDMVDADAYEIHRYESALIDRYGAIFPPEDVPAGFGGWKIAIKNGVQSSVVKGLIGKLREGQYGVVPIKTKSQDEVLLFNGLRDTIKVTPYEISCGRTKIANFVVHMPDVAGKSVPHYYWSARYNDRVKEMSNIYALSYEILQQRKFTADVSTFKALELAGCDIKACITYVLDKSQPDPTDVEAVAEFPTKSDIQTYLEGGYEADTLPANVQVRMDVIDDIVNGVTNTDRVASGMKLDAQIDIDIIYKYLYCAHFCRTKVSISDMYKLVQDVSSNVTKVPVSLETTGKNVDVLQLKSDVYTIDVPCEEQRAKINGYISDIEEYTNKQAAQCCGFLKVIRIAKEYGAQGCNRHVAFEALTVNLLRDGKVATRNLERLIEIYEQNVQRLPIDLRRDALYYKRRVCMQYYFKVAEEGYMIFPNYMNLEPYKLPEDLLLSIKSTIKTKITSTAVYCAKMYENGCFTHFCVNADITPYYIYPKSTHVIPAAPFPGLWYDWNSMGSPAIRQKLVASGVIPSTFIPWTNRYMSERYFATDGMVKEANLVNYMMYCNEFRAATKPNEEFTRAPHLESLLYPGVTNETTRVEHGTNLRNEGEVPGMVVSVGEMITDSTFANHLALDIKSIRDTRTIRPFTGFTAEDFDVLGDIDKVNLPVSENDQYIVVNEDDDTISIENQENMPAYTLSQLVGKGHPITNIWGRKYVFCDLFGVMWEATI